MVQYDGLRYGADSVLMAGVALLDTPSVELPGVYSWRDTCEPGNYCTKEAPHLESLMVQGLKPVDIFHSRGGSVHNSVVFRHEFPEVGPNNGCYGELINAGHQWFFPDGCRHFDANSLALSIRLNFPAGELGDFTVRGCGLDVMSVDGLLYWGDTVVYYSVPTNADSIQFVRDPVGIQTTVFVESGDEVKIHVASRGPSSDCQSIKTGGIADGTQISFKVYSGRLDN
eukprot:Trichotokara_eunicae@DN6167_c0_g1_i2.p1